MDDWAGPEHVVLADLGYEGASLDDLSDEELQTNIPEIIAVLRAVHDYQLGELKAMPKLPALAAAAGSAS